MADDQQKESGRQSVLTIPQAADICAVSRWTMRNLVTAGEIKAARTRGGHYRILKEDLESFVRQNKAYSKITSEPGRTKKILVVDDDIGIQKLLQRVLSVNGYELAFASDGFEAGQKLMTFHPQLVILDLFMPKIDGFEVCRRIKADPVTADTKILAISGFDTRENRQRIFEAGADRFVEKPLDQSSVRQIITQLIG